MDATQRAVHDALVKAMVDKGKLIEAGWLSLRLQAVPPDAPQVQIDEMRMAYMAGAQHLFSSIITMFDADAEPTAKDMQRMSLVATELEGIADELRLRVARPGGSA